MTNDKTRTRACVRGRYCLGMRCGVDGASLSGRATVVTSAMYKKIFAPYAYAWDTGDPRHLLCNPDIFFVFLSYLYGLPGNLLGTKKAPSGGSREPVRGDWGDIGCIPGGLNASVQSDFAFVNLFLAFSSLLG